MDDYKELYHKYKELYLKYKGLYHKAISSFNKLFWFTIIFTSVVGIAAGAFLFDLFH